MIFMMILFFALSETTKSSKVGILLKAKWQFELLLFYIQDCFGSDF